MRDHLNINVSMYETKDDSGCVNGNGFFGDI